MERFSVLEVIEQAVQTEKLGNQFYTNISNRFEKNEKLRSLFEKLAVKELAHAKTFSGLKEIIGDEEPDGWEEASQYLRAIIESAFFLGKDKSLLALEDVKTVSDAVNHALGFEKETLLYYFGIRDGIKEKEVVDEIINEEKSHIMWLKKFAEGLAK